LAAISQAHQLKSVILSFVYSLFFKSSKVIIHTDKPHHLPSHTWLFQPESKPICTCPRQGKPSYSTACLHCTE